MLVVSRNNMEFEINLEGPEFAIKRLSRILTHWEIRLVKVVPMEPDSTPLAAIILKETDPDRLDAKLRQLASFVSQLEKELNLSGAIRIRVRNLGYSEPPSGSEDFFEAFNPVPSLTIQPWSPSLSRELASNTVILDPRHAFGTGKHPSTKISLQILEDASRGAYGGGPFTRWKVLDFGCGTGILAIAALRLGAKVALGVEIDSESARAAERNISLNRLSDRIQIRQGSWEVVDEEYDLVLANVVPSVLYRTGECIPKHLKKGGIAAVSGFGENLTDEMMQFFSKAGLRTLRQIRLGTWGGLLLAHGA